SKGKARQDEARQEPLGKARNVNAEVTFKRSKPVIHIPCERLRRAVLLVFHSTKGVIPILRHGRTDLYPRQLRVLGIEPQNAVALDLTVSPIAHRQR
nr:hypothetical protein [Tanacetum cinerariifolium]